MSSVTEGIALIVSREQRLLRRNVTVLGHSPEETAISRAAHSAGRLAAGSTVDRITGYLHTSIKHPEISVSEGFRKQSQIFDQDIRDKRGYGELDDELIRYVNRGIAQLIPEYGLPSELVRIVAARTMQLVRQRPRITPGVLRDDFMPGQADHPLIRDMPAILSPAEAACIDSVVTTAHYLTASFYGIEGEQ